MKSKSYSIPDSNPKLYIDLDLIESNARFLNVAAGDFGLEIVGVVKGVRGDLKVAESIVRAGIGILADSHIENLDILKKHFIVMDVKPPKLYLLRQPLLNEIERASRIADLIMCHTFLAAESLNRAATDANRKIDIVVPIDLGYGREGVLPDELPTFLDQIQDLPNIYVYGISVISNCEMPSGGSAHALLPKIDAYQALDQMKELVRISIEQFPCKMTNSENAQVSELGTGQTPADDLLASDLKHVSGGNSGVVSLLFDQKIPEGIKQLTIGEAILLGRDTLSGEISPGLSGDAFMVDAEIMQVKKADDGFKVLLAIGKQEIGSGTLSIFGMPGVSSMHNAQVISKISSDHYEIFIPQGDETENFIDEMEPGQKIMLYPDYFALLGLMVDPQISKIYRSK